MDILPETFAISLTEQRAQLEDPLENRIICFHWNPTKFSVVVDLGDKLAEFNDYAITVREILRHIGYVVPVVEMMTPRVSVENFLDMPVRTLPLCQASLSLKTQTAPMQNLLQMLQTHSRAKRSGDSLYFSISSFAKNVLFYEDGTPCMHNIAILAEHGFPVRETKPDWQQIGIQTPKGIIHVSTPNEL